MARSVADAVQEKCQQEGQPLQAFVASGTVSSAEAFEIDRVVDVEESEAFLTYLQVSFEDILADPDDPRRNRRRAQLKSHTKELGSDVVRVLEHKVDHARQDIEGGAGPRLLNCINRVIMSGSRARTQAMLQKLVMQYTDHTRDRNLKLPPGMETPRSAIHTRDRLQYFGRLRKEMDIPHYLHSSEFRSQKALLDMSANRPGSPASKAPVDASSPPPSPSRSPCRSLLGTPTAFPSPFVPGSRATSPLGPVGTLTDWYSGLPSTPNMPKRKVGERKLKDRGMTSELARKTRIGRDGQTLEALSNLQDVNIQQSSDLAVHDMDSTDTDTLRLLQVSADFMAQRYRGRYGRKAGDNAESKRNLRYVDTLDQDMAMPRLMGVTSGFADKDPVPSCPWTRAPEGGWPKAERHLVDGVLPPGVEAERPSSRSNVSTLPPVDARGTRTRMHITETLKPRNSILGPGGRASVKLSVRPDSKGEAVKPGDSQGLSQAKGRLSASSTLSRGSFCPVDWRAMYDSQLSGSTKRFLQERGMERKGGHDAVRSVTPVNVLKSASQPSLPKKVCLPMESWLSTDTERERDQLSLVQRSCTPEVGYFRGCMHEKINPRLVKFLAAPSSKLDFQSLLLGDSDLEAVLEALHAPSRGAALQQDLRQPVIHINLAHNKRLSDIAVARFLTTSLRGSHIAGSACVGPLKSLNLSHCSALGESTINVLAALLGQGSELIALAELDLSGVAIPVRSWSTFTDGLKIRRSLRRLCLAQTECGRHSQLSCLDVAGLIEGGACRNLEYIDISGNHFLHEGCQAIGRALRCTSDTMQEIDLSHNAGFACKPPMLEPVKAPVPEEEKEGEADDADEEGDASADAGDPSADAGNPAANAMSFNPIMHVLEVLGETTVTRVSFVNCQLQYAEDCILEDVVQSSDISHLDVADNPHGVEGLRCLVRLLVQSKQGGRALERLNLQTVRNHVMPSETLTYDHVYPSACYKLFLQNPQHRAILRLLLKRGEKFTKGKGEEFNCFKDEMLDGKRLANGLRDLCSKRTDRGGDDWQVPERGILSFSFTQPPFYNPKDDVGTVIVKFSRIQKVAVNFKSFSRLQSLYWTLPDERSKLMILSAMGHDLVFKLCQVRHFTSISPDLFLFIVVTLMPAVEEQAWHTSRLQLFALVQSCQKKGTEHMVQQIKAETRSMLYFNAQHADGHYTLNLANKVDRSIAQRCIVISNWVRNKSKTLALLDLSEHENQECLRHTLIGKNFFAFDSETYQLPEDEVLSFDLVLPRLQLDDSKTTDPKLIDQLCSTLHESRCNFRDRLRALRLVAHSLTLRPKQLRQIVEVFPEWSSKYGRGSASRRRRSNTDESKQFHYDFRPRAEAYILFYNRTIFHAEVVSPNILYNDEIFHRDEVKEIRARLGYIHTFDVVNAHDNRSNLGNKHGPLDMSTWDGRAIVKLLMAVSATEPSPNFYFTEWSEKADLAARGYAFIIPAEWVTELPQEGNFLTTFESHAEEVDWEQRRAIAKEMLGWTFPPDAELTLGLQECMAEASLPDLEERSEITEIAEGAPAEAMPETPLEARTLEASMSDEDEEG